MSEQGLGLIGRYRLLRLLAQGGMGQVWEACRIDRLEERVALKVLVATEDLGSKKLRMFLDEARIGAMLEHPNLVRVLDVGLAGGTPYLVMERLEGWPLSALLDGEPMPLGLVLGVGLQALEGLGHAHHARGADGRPLGIVHRDIKPSNLFVSTSGAVRVLDFGIAQLAGRTCSTRGSIAGSLPYCSPEQLQEQPLDARSDLFSLGAVLHEMLTGRRLFDRAGSGAIITAIVYGTTPPVSSLRAGIPASVDRAVMSALAKAPRGRPATADELARALRAGLAEDEVWDPARIAAWLASRPRPTRGATEEIRPVALAPPRQTAGTVVSAPGSGQPGEPTTSRRRLPWGRILGAVTAIVALSLVGSALFRPRPRPAAAVDTVPGAPTLPASRLSREGASAPANAGLDVQASIPQRPLETIAGAPAPAPSARDLIPGPARSPKRPPRSSPTRSATLRTAGAKPERAHAGNGWLNVDSRPTWATVSLDGKPLGPTPLYKQQIEAGTHRIEARREDGRTQSKSVTVEPGTEKTVILLW